MKQVLIALDYDPAAERIAQTGYTIGKALGAGVTLLHVVAPVNAYANTDYSPIMGFSGFNAFEVGNPAELEADIEKEALRFLKQCRLHLGDETINVLTIHGGYAEGILATAATIGAELLVMGTHQRSGLEKFFTGSIAETVLHQSKLPVLVVPEKSK